MLTQSRPLFWLAIVLGTYLVRCSAWADVKLTSSIEDAVREQSNKVDALFAEFNMDTPGCAVGVDLDGRSVHFSGYGMADIEQSVPVTPATVFYAASVSKQFTGMAAALLAQDEMIDLDAPVSDYIAVVPTYARQVTIRQALHHTTGIRDYFPLFALSGRYRDRIVSEELILDLMRRQKGLNFDPGTNWSYSNSAYLLVSLVIREAAGKELGAYAEERIFAPLGMQDSRFQHRFRDLVPRRAHGYVKGADGNYLHYDVMDNVVGGGGLYTTVFDLIRWSRNYFDNKLGGHSDLVELMETSGVLSSGKETGYGLGLMLQQYRGTKVVRHSGNLVGYRSELQRFPEHDLSIAVLCNSAAATPQLYAQDIADIYLGTVLEKQRDTGNREAKLGGDFSGLELSMSPGDLSSFSGLYYSYEVDNTLDIRLTQHGLRVYGIELPPGRIEGNVVIENGMNTLDQGYILVRPIADNQFHNPGLHVRMTYEKLPEEVYAPRLFITVPGAYGVEFVRVDEGEIP